MKTEDTQILELINPSPGHKLPVGVGINIRWEMASSLQGAFEIKIMSTGKNRIQLAGGLFYSLSKHGEIIINRSIFEDETVGDETSCELVAKFIGLTKEIETSIPVKISKYPALNYASWTDNHKEVSGRKPIIFIHGLNPTFPGREDKAWDPILERLSSEEIDLFSDFKPFIFSYDSSDVFFAESNSPSIADVARHMGTEIERLKKSKIIESDEIYVVAHSMGGLVTRALMASDSDKIHRLITLATPHHGTPVASLFKGYIDSNFVDEISWDNFDGLYDEDKNPNNFLKELNNSEKNGEILGKIVAFAGKVVDPKKSLIEFVNPIRMGLNFFKHDNDGAVPVSSALFEGAEILAREILEDVDHFSICKDEKVTTKLLKYLKDNNP